jgi:ABC-type polysaccharide/polyol phosphate transport system ATPase subunit
MSLRNQLVQIGTGGKLLQEKENILTVTALNNVDFEIKDGDAIGLIGHNGAGKTTLLRTMAGIYFPTHGIVDVTGSISTIIELGAGMDPELSGFENIFRMGLLLGYSRKDMDMALAEIEDFTELGDFLLTPVRTYSSGMTMRLMFAVATCIRPEILLIDEMFATGDDKFQLKVKKRMEKLIDSAKIFVFASHSTEMIKSYCNKAFVLEHGTLTRRALSDI